MKKVAIIGSGFSSLSAACYLAQMGLEVHVYEKNDQLGGRARVLEEEGFRFDMGPSWYWMPDVFERFFADFDRSPSEFYDLVRLDPSYRVYFPDRSNIEVPSSPEELYSLFEKEEPGSSKELRNFLEKARFNYETAMKDLVYKPGESLSELISPATLFHLNRFFTTIHKSVTSKFKNPKLIQLLEFPVLFLGAKPEDTPAFYSFMNYADLSLGTWYPMGGMHKIVEAMVKLGESLGVRYHTNASVEAMSVSNRSIRTIRVNGEDVRQDIVLSGADYQHTESLLGASNRSYSEKYWNTRTFAPSALIFYLGFNKKIDDIRHHCLFFDRDFSHHAQQIYDNPAWPEAPLFYGCFPSVTDPSVAPEGHENAFILVPLAPGLEDSEEMRDKCFNQIIDRLEGLTNQQLRNHIVYKRSYCVNDFKQDYNSYKGNAYGMANTLRQTAFLRPGIRSKKIDNLYFTGQLTVPGPGVPPALISGKIASGLIEKEILTNPKYASVQ